MPITRLLKTKLIEPLIDQIVDRVSDRVAHLLDQHALLLPETKRVLEAQPSIVESDRHDGDLPTWQRYETESMSYSKVIGVLPPPQHPPAAPRRQSELCKQADFSLDAYRYWSSAVGLVPTFHRKHWEFFYLCQALYERGLLDEERTGLGFGVGHEPLPALFAYLGCTIIATDQREDDAVKAGWQETRQHADGIAVLERPDICDPTIFRERVSFEVVDMNNMPAHFGSRFDFCWSVCCLEHLGSIDNGLRFIENSLDTLQIGGVAIHTKEFNLSSNTATLESPGTSIYRRCDIEALVKKLEQVGHHVEPLNLSQGTTLVDGYVDLPPYHNEPHLRLRIAEYDCTSIGLIITRGQ